MLFGHCMQSARVGPPWARAASGAGDVCVSLALAPRRAEIGSRVRRCSSADRQSSSSAMTDSPHDCQPWAARSAGAAANAPRPHLFSDRATVDHSPAPHQTSVCPRARRAWRSVSGPANNERRQADAGFDHRILTVRTGGLRRSAVDVSRQRTQHCRDLRHHEPTASQPIGGSATIATRAS